MKTIQERVADVVSIFPKPWLQRNGWISVQPEKDATHFVMTQKDVDNFSKKLTATLTDIEAEYAKEKEELVMGILKQFDHEVPNLKDWTDDDVAFGDGALYNMYHYIKKIAKKQNIQL